MDLTMDQLPTQEPLFSDSDAQEPASWGRFVPSTDRFPTGIIKTQTFKIGRRSENDLCLSHPAISGYHCTISRDENSKLVFITDHSTNGTYIGTEKIGKSNRRVLGSGDRVMLLCSETDKIYYTFYLEESRSNHVGDYIIEKSLGSGAFAEVLLVVHSKTGKRYAMKRIDRKKLNMAALPTSQCLNLIACLTQIVSPIRTRTPCELGNCWSRRRGSNSATALSPQHYWNP